ncbi:MAG: hypothetical protein IKH75_00290 [Ruminococcus sp.]|nr:hypothetical protein [Ruminococcus sp.]
MREYGGYIELDTYRLPMLHEGAIALNCGRNCLAYLIESKKIKKILLPYFMCESVFNLCKKYRIDIGFYHIDDQFKPQGVNLEEDTWFYVMNYYGQLSREYLSDLTERYNRVIIDNAQAYFEEPIPNADTIYTCRKFFGVPDGAFLYTNIISDEQYPLDESFERMHFLLGRFERSASEFYNEYSNNNHLFADEPIKQMSKLTENLLHGIDYSYVNKTRASNFREYHKALKSINKLQPHEVQGAFAYPLLVENGREIRHTLQQTKIYIPTLWPNVLDEVPKDSIEYQYAENILPLPCDQRYCKEDIGYIVCLVQKYI